MSNLCLLLLRYRRPLATYRSGARRSRVGSHAPSPRSTADVTSIITKTGEMASNPMSSMPSDSCGTMKADVTGGTHIRGLEAM